MLNMDIPPIALKRLLEEGNVSGDRLHCELILIFPTMFCHNDSTATTVTGEDTDLMCIIPFGCIFQKKVINRLLHISQWVRMVQIILQYNSSYPSSQDAKRQVL